MTKKAQSATEFMLTYGWLILIAIIVVAAMAHFGVFNPSSWEEPAEPHFCWEESLECVEWTNNGETYTAFIEEWEEVKLEREVLRGFGGRATPWRYVEGSSVCVKRQLVENRYPDPHFDQLWEGRCGP